MASREACASEVDTPRNGIPRLLANNSASLPSSANSAATIEA